MGPKKHRACEKCVQNCALFHGKGKTSSISPSSVFFKVMIGDDFSRVLYFPPMFSSTASALVNKKMTLKDSSGKQWTATVTTVDNSFALKEGWEAFASGHGLEIGDFIVFNYIHELELDVIIFGRSGSVILDFSKRKNKKRRRTDSSGSPVRDGMLPRRGGSLSISPKPDVPKMNGKDKENDAGRTRNNIEKILKSIKSNGTAQSMGINENREDPRRMKSQDYSRVDETWKVTTGNSKVSHVDHASLVYQNDATPCKKYPLFEGIMGSGAASDASKVESGKSLGDTHRSEHVKTSASKLDDNRGNNFIKSNNEVQECQSPKGLESDQVVTIKEKQNTKQMFNGIPNVSDAIHSGASSKDICETSTRMMKEHAVKIPNRSSFNDKFGAEKGEMLNTMKKEHAVKIPNESSFNDKFGAEKGEMSQMLKKEHADRIPPNWSSFNDKLCQTTRIEHANRIPNCSSFNDKLSAEGEMLTRIKKESVDMTVNLPSFKNELGATGLSRDIKLEPGQSSHMQSSAPVSCVVPTDNDDYLELPERLPCHRRRVTMDRMVVFLRDSRQRLWPVLYHQLPTLKVLTTGWSQFRRANNIQPTDVCTFGIKDESRHVYTVEIVRNP